MKCIYCGEEMEYKRSYGNGYDEPVEEIYECPRCWELLQKFKVSKDPEKLINNIAGIYNF